MRIMLLYNPIAGKARAARTAEGLRARLAEAGHAAALTPTEPDPPADWLVSSLESHDLLLVIGGDGAARLAAGPASRTGTPLYCYPLGTENLFAREMGYDRSEARLLRSLERFEVRRVDQGTAGDRTFLLMASQGLDACMVRDLARARRGGISHLSYVAPLLRQLVGWRAPRLTILVDDQPVVREKRGFVVVGNSRHYAVRLDPAKRASMTDGRLDVVFFPCRSGATALAWWMACRFRWHIKGERVPYHRGSRVRVHADPAHPYQLDGDDPGATSPASELSLGVRAGAVPVLVPF